MSKNRVGVAGNVLVICVVVVALFRPAGPIGAAISRWQLESEQRRVVRDSWNQISSGPRLDADTVGVRLVEFVDYECRICKRQHTSMQQLIDSGRIAGVAVLHLPLSVYARSEGAALAAICAESQGRFREMHHRLFTSTEWVTDANWRREAAAAGVPELADFETCVEGDEARARLARDVELAQVLGIRATPVFAHPEDGVIRGMLADSTLIRLAAVR